MNVIPDEQGLGCTMYETAALVLANVGPEDREEGSFKPLPTTLRAALNVKPLYDPIDGMLATPVIVGRRVPVLLV